MNDEIGSVAVQGRPLRCIICSHDAFREHHLNLGNAVFSFLDPDSTAHCAVCARCGYVHMFLPKATIDAGADAPAAVPPAAPA